MASHPSTAGLSRLFPLTREAIAERLARPAPPPGPDELHRITLGEGARVTYAAVMVPLVNRPEGLQLLLTQRTAHLADHAGQISFPGGRVEPQDASREETAFRETEEEIGLARTHVALLGRLPDYEIPSGFRITPIVGWIEPPFELRPDPIEVAEVFEVPLAHLLDPANQQRHFRMLGERRRDYWAIPYGERFIWGATAAMLLMMDRTLRDPG